MNRKQLYIVLKVSFKDWLKDNCTQRAAALTFFIILPLPTLLLIVINFFALFIGQSQATQILIKQITALAGPTVANLFNEVIGSTTSPFTSVWSAIIVVGFSISGAIGAFSVLRDTMDRIWEVKTPEGLPLWKRIRKTIVPFIVVSALGLIVVAWTAIAGKIFEALIVSSINGTLLLIAFTIAQLLLSFAIVTLLLVIIYKIIPQAKIRWKDVAFASIVAGTALTITNYLFGTYIQAFTVTTVAGVAGTLLIILLWIFALNAIILFGAEISKVYASTIGEHEEEHLPSPVEKAVEPMQKIGEKIEDAAKGDVVETGKPRVKSGDKEGSNEQA
jgi:membrane protein